MRQNRTAQEEHKNTRKQEDMKRKNSVARMKQQTQID